MPTLTTSELRRGVLACVAELSPIFLNDTAMSVRERQTWEQLEGMLSEALTPLGLTRGMHQGCEEAMKGHSESACRMRVEWFGGSLWEITVLAANTTDHRKRHLYWRIFSHFLQSPEAAMDGIPTPM